MSRLLRFVAIYLLVAGTTAVFLLISLWPWRPSSLEGWVLYAIWALPVVIAGEWVCDKVLANPVSRVVDRITRPHRFSWLRIGYLVALVLALIVLGLLGILLWHR